MEERQSHASSPAQTPAAALQISPWDRLPAASDAERAYCPLDLAAVQRMKQALRGGRESIHLVQHLKPGGPDPLLAAEAAQEPLAWPTEPNISTETLPSLHSDMQSLVDACNLVFIPHVYFLHDLPMDFFPKIHDGSYLTIAMACVGSLVAAQEQRETTIALFWLSLRLLARQLEVNNREARKLDLVKAWVLLETYGFLSSDPLTWKRTSMAHGYVEAAVWRLVSEPSRWPSSLVPEDDKSPIRSLISYFLMIDLLRAMHYGQPSPVAASELIVSFSSPFPDRLSCGETISQKIDAAGSAMSETVALHQLLPILARVHIIAAVFEPMLKPRPSQTNMTSKDIASCPSIPFSTMEQLAEHRRTAADSLRNWRCSFLESCGAEVSLLYHFAQMYLAFSSLQALVDIVGYGPRFNVHYTFGSTLPAEQLIADCKQNRHVLQHAWKILDVANACQTSSTVKIPIWRPIVLFYAALAIWAHLSVDLSDGSAIGISQALQFFISKLQELEFQCCSDMILVLDSLRSRSLKTL